MTERIWPWTLSADAKETLRVIGNFGPTVDPLARTVKGYAEWGDDEGGKVYLDPDALRHLAAGLTEAADYLDARAAAAPPTQRPDK